MIPVLVSLGSFHLYSYGLSIAVGVMLSLFLMQHRAKREGFPAGEDIMDMAFVIVLWGFVGARLFYVLQNLEYYLSAPLKFFAVWEGGLIFYGGIFVGMVGFIRFVRKKKLPFWKLLDFVAPYVALAHAFGRLGCFLNGCCYGKVCDLPWAVRFPELAHRVHPAQLYEAFFDLVLFFLLLSRAKRAKFEGEISLLYLLLYAMGRYLIEFLREPSWTWLGLTSNQWLSALIIAAAFVLFKLRRPRVP